MTQAEILSPWHEETEDGEIGRWPLVTSEYSLDKWTDITGQPAAELSHGQMVSLLVECDPGVLAAIAQDDRFEIVWSEPLP